MSDTIAQFIANYTETSGTAVGEITSRFTKKLVAKNEYLLREGQVCKDLVYVNKGCLRLFYISEGLEVSVWFSFDKSSAIEISSFINGQPSSYFIQAIEDSEIFVLPKTELSTLYHSHPFMQEWMRRFLEDIILNLLDRFNSLQRDTAEKRYLDLLNKPDYLKLIPQKYLASFIGITPTSLSRIRRNIR